MREALVARYKPTFPSLLTSDAIHCDTNLSTDQQAPHKSLANNKTMKLVESAYIARTPKEPIRVSLNGL